MLSPGLWDSSKTNLSNAVTSTSEVRDPFECERDRSKTRTYSSVCSRVRKRTVHRARLRNRTGSPEPRVYCRCGTGKGTVLRICRCLRMSRDECVGVMRRVRDSYNHGHTSTSSRTLRCTVLDCMVRSTGECISDACIYTRMAK